jgi:hypothetical protein
MFLTGYSYCYILGNTKKLHFGKFQNMKIMQLEFKITSNLKKKKIITS